MQKKILMIIAPQNFRDEELQIPKEIFEKNNFQVTIASKGINDANGSLGAISQVDLDISEVVPGDYDAVIFVGGGGATVFFENETALDIARDTVTEKKVLGAICIAPSILANAEILMDKKATSFSSEKTNLEQHGATFTGNPVEIDGKLVTADGPKSAKEFAETIIKLLEK
jgi:protease I